MKLILQQEKNWKKGFLFEKKNKFKKTKKIKIYKRLGFNSVALDATAKSCRNGESNLGNFLCGKYSTCFVKILFKIF